MTDHDTTSVPLNSFRFNLIHSTEDTLMPHFPVDVSGKVFSVCCGPLGELGTGTC